jgi:hypothetical protein
MGVQPVRGADVKHSRALLDYQIGNFPDLVRSKSCLPPRVMATEHHGIEARRGSTEVAERKRAEPVGSCRSTTPGGVSTEGDWNRPSLFNEVAERNPTG